MAPKVKSGTATLSCLGRTYFTPKYDSKKLVILGATSKAKLSNEKGKKGVPKLRKKNQQPQTLLHAVCPVDSKRIAFPMEVREVTGTVWKFFKNKLTACNPCSPDGPRCGTSCC